MKKKTNIILSLLIASPITSALAQSSQMSPSTAFYIISGFVFLISVLVLAVAVVVLRLLKSVVRRELEKMAEAKGVPFVEEPSWWSKFLRKANDAVPIEEEETVMLDHDYDGIRELDNHLPPWWKWLFYLTIVFGIVYMTAYHVIGNLPLQTEEYQAEMYAAEEAMKLRLADAPQATIDISTIEPLTDESALQKGRQIYVNNCSQCHKDKGEGGIGPNLTDEYWLHGGDIASIFVTIKNGVPEKGMISWEPLLSGEQMLNAASYILSLQGTNPPNAKGPQGELYIPEATNEIADSVSIAAKDSLAVSELN